MKTRTALLAKFPLSITMSWLAASAAVRGITANSGVTTPKLRGGGPKLDVFGLAKAGS